MKRWVLDLRYLEPKSAEAVYHLFWALRRLAETRNPNLLRLELAEEVE